MATATPVTLAPLPPPPSGQCPQIRRPWRYLDATHKSVTGLLDSFNLVRTTTVTANATAKGRLGSDQEDLLRAALVFTSSGLDACCQQLVREAAQDLIDRGGTAATQFRLYLDGELQGTKAPDGFLDAITAPDPRRQLIDRYVEAKTTASFQGSSDLQKRVRDLLGIPNQKLPKTRFMALDDFFTARNDIVHQLDYVDPASTSVSRNRKSATKVATECGQVLALIADLIHATADLLRSKSAST